MSFDYSDENCDDCYWCISNRCTLMGKDFPVEVCNEFSDSERFDFIDI